MTKKQKKSCIILMVLFVLLLGIYGIMQYLAAQEEKKQEEEKEAATVFVTDVAVEDITNFSYIVDDVTYNYEKREDEWICTNDASLDLEESQIETLLGNLAKLTSETSFSDYENLEDYGLTQPENILKFTADGTETTLYLGAYNGMLQQYYLKTEAKDEIYLMADNTLWTAFDVTPDTMVVEEETETTENAETTENTETTESTEVTTE